MDDNRGNVAPCARATGARRRVRRVKWRRAALAATVLVATLAFGAAGASAVVVHLKSGRKLGYQPVKGTAAVGRQGGQPKANSNSQLEYHGGRVMPSNTNYTLYWDPAGGPEYPAGYQAGIDRYFEDIAHDSGGLLNTDSVLTQYNDGTSAAAYDSHFAGALIDTHPYPANGCSSAAKCLTDEQLRAEIRTFVEANKLPMDRQHEYFLLTPAGVESCFEAAGKSCSQGASHASYCAYHGFIPVGGQVIVYANDPYVNGLNCDTGEEHPNGNPSDATIGGGLAHEHSESVTDPELNAWYDSKGNESADKCRTFKAKTEFGEPLGKAPNGASYNQVINSHLYLYPQEWSNQAAACSQRAATLPKVTKLSPKSGTKNGGTAVTITGSGFTGTVTVKFGATAAGEVTVNSSSSINAVSPAESPGPVSVTVTTAAGASAANKKAVFKYKSK
jgi:IPT/TIG domain